MTDDLFTDEFRMVPTGKLLARVARARDAGDWRDAAPEWWACIARAKARVVYVVEGRALRGLIPRSRVDDLVQETLIRGARRLVVNLADLSEDAFFAAMVMVAKRECQTEGQKHKAAKGTTTSLDQPSGRSDDDDPAFDQLTAKEAARAWELGNRHRELAQAFDRLIPQLRDERARAILTADRVGGVSDDDLADQLGITKPNLQQIRSRALRELAQNQELRGLIDP